MNTEAQTQESTTDRPVAFKPMTKSRIILVVGLTMLLLLGHGYCVVSRQEFWPFSNYPMYSQIYTDSWTNEFLVGVSSEPPSHEVPISYFVYARPISIRMVLHTFHERLKKDPANTKQFEEVVAGLGQLYMQKQGGNRPHDFKPISAVRVYKMTWQVFNESGTYVSRIVNREMILHVDLDFENHATDKTRV